MAKKKPGKQQIAEWLTLKQNSLGLSIRGLAKAIGISDSTLRTYLDFTSPYDPQADTLRRIAEFLGVDELEMFIVAYDLPDPEGKKDATEYYLLTLYRRLSDKDKKNAVRIIETLAGASQETGELIREAIAKGKQLRLRQLDRMENLLRSIGTGLRVQTKQNAVPTISVFLRHVDRSVADEEINKVMEHTLARAIMNVLVPRNDMESWEKLLYLVFPGADQTGKITDRTKKEIQDTWDTLLWATEKEVQV